MKGKKVLILTAFEKLNNLLACLIVPHEHAKKHHNDCSQWLQRPLLFSQMHVRISEVV